MQQEDSKPLIRSNDPKVIEFLKYLGVQTECCTSVTIEVEAVRPVQVVERRRCKKPQEDDGPSPTP